MKMRHFSILNQTKDNFPFYIYKTSMSKLILEHDHDFWELVYIYSGQGEYIIGNEKFTFAQNQLILTPPNLPHSFLTKAGKTHSQVSLTIYPEVLSKMVIAGVKINSLLNEFWDSGKSFISLSVADAVVIESIIETIYNEYQIQSEHYDSLIALEITRLLILWERLEADTSSVFLRFKNLPWVLLLALQSIETGYAKISGLKGIINAANADLNERYFIRLFKKHISMTPIQYLNRVKIEKAASLLLNPHYSISRIAFDSGFADLRFFNRQFKRFVKITPRNFRKEAVHNPKYLKRADRFSEQT